MKPLLLFFIFISINSYAQNIKIDSLTNLIEKADNDLNKAKLLLLRSKQFASSQLNNALDDAQNALILYKQNQYAEGAADANLLMSDLYAAKSNYKQSLAQDSTALEISITNQLKKHEALALSNIGRNLSQLGNLKSAQQALEKSISKFTQLSMQKDLAEAYSRFGVNLFMQSQRESALAQYDQAEKIALKENMENLLAKVYMLKGNYFADKAEYEKATEYHIKCMRLREKMKDERGLIQSYTNIAIVLRGIKELEQAIGYIKKAIALAKKYGNLNALGNNYCNLANMYLQMNRLDSVEYLYKQALISFQTSEEKPGIEMVYYNYGNYLITQNRLTEAEANLYKSLEVNKITRSIIYLARNYQALGALFMKTGDNKKAEYYLTESLKLLKDENGPREADAYKRLSDFYKSVRNFDKAQQYETAFWSLQDTLYTQKEITQSLKIQTAYEIEKRDAKLALEKKEKELQQLLVAKKNEQFNYLLAGFALVLIIGIILLRAYQKQQKLSYQLKQQNTQIETLMHELHHRVKNNLQLVSGLLSLQSLRTHDPIVKEAINQGRTRLDAMALIHQKLYTQNKSSNVNMQEYIISLTHSLAESFGYSDKNINTSIQLTNQLFDIDVAIPVGLIVNELVTNAFKHAFDSKDEPLVSIQLNSLSNEQMQLIIADNGKGIDANAPEKPGSFGMNLVQTLVRQLNGNMEIKTNGGTYYSITFNK